jgi:hypothetical protein
MHLQARRTLDDVAIAFLVLVHYWLDSHHPGNGELLKLGNVSAYFLQKIAFLR